MLWGRAPRVTRCALTLGYHRAAPSGLRFGEDPGGIGCAISRGKWDDVEVVATQNGGVPIATFIWAAQSVSEAANSPCADFE